MRRQSAWLGLVLGTMLVACSEDDPTQPDSTAPARVTDLTVKSAITNVVQLRWTTPGDNGTEGTAASYQVRWSPNIITEDKFESAHQIQDPPIPKSPGTVELFSVPHMDITRVIHFAIRTYDEAGHISEVSNDALWTPGGLPIQFIQDIPAFKDNTIFAEADSLSNGAGQYLFSGRTVAQPDSLIRRALLAFAIADSIPAGAQIDSVRLTLHMSKTPAGPRLVRLHAATADWGEGASNAGGEEESGIQAETGDATWAFRFYDTSAWVAPGGDFAFTQSAQSTVVAPGFYSWSNSPMKDDVQSWLDVPADNHGWVVVGDESSGRTLKRFASREHPTGAYRPRLRVYYTIIPSP